MCRRSFNQSAPAGNVVLRLVVDDYALGAEAIALALSQAGHEARFAFSADMAFERIQSWTPDVAVLDINMPWPDGFELAARLHATSHAGDAVLIAYINEGVVKPMGIKVGFDGFYRKGKGVAPLLAMMRLLHRCSWGKKQDLPARGRVICG
ncbi:MULTISPECIES: response regulator [Caballeronia]|uniref:response regulator n=1 Tax=Caballeronia TaxID=1827195 RepID=UPI00158EE7EF